MVFYKIEALREFDEALENLSIKEKRELSTSLSEKSEYLFQRSNYKSIIVTTGIKNNLATFIAVANNPESVEKMFAKYMDMLPFKIARYRTEEITFANFHSALISAVRSDFIRDNNEILDRFEIVDLSPRFSTCNFSESLIDTSRDITSIKKVAKDLLFTETMIPEVERIYQNSNVKKVQGHPVHYIIQADGKNLQKDICENLLAALYNNDRIQNKRYTFVDCCNNDTDPGYTLETLYKTSEGGAIVIQYANDGLNSSNFASNGADAIPAICETAVKYKQKVLTILCIEKSNNIVKDSFISNWGKTFFVEIHEDIVFGEKAVEYLKSKAKEHKIRSDKNLIGNILEEKGYTGFELDSIFDDWYQEKLRNEIYPQYKTATTLKIKIKEEKPRGNAYDNLQSLIGLKNAKDVMDKALNYFKVQKMFADKGLKNERPAMHMVFTGNPGTAKTTVARLFAEIMRDNGLLSKGTIYEVGRADLVGKFVGHTAPLVKNAFKKAKGGVLFIDEAYSLVDDRDGSFGDEAINTIVQEMENNRKDTIVIFAGYPDKMEGFLNKNPGLRSRIAFHIPFDNYCSNELCEIAEHIANEKGFHIDNDAKQKLNNVFLLASKRPDFGNGRYARNVIENAKMSQANRLINMDFDKITEKDVFTLLADDFEIEQEAKQDNSIKIGFCA